MTTEVTSKNLNLEGRTPGLSGLTMQLTRARFSQRQGESLLYFASILAYTVCSALALTVAAGTWMFYRRWQAPTGTMADLLKIDPTYYEIVFMIYFCLALLACALVIPSAVSLASKAAVLGAKGRERRLASLRLLGLSSAEVTKMTLFESLIQSVIGGVLGAAIYLLTIPAWSNLEMEAQQIRPAEMLLPWWLGLAVLAIIITLCLLSSWWGLQQVRISPLGVARKTNKPAVRRWRVLAFVVIVGAALIANQVMRLGNVVTAFIIIGSIILAIVLGFNLLGPYLIQLLARVLTQFGSAPILLASRSIIADPIATWRRASGMGLLAFIGGYISMMPITLTRVGDADEIVENFFSSAQWDFNKGAAITIIVGFILCSTSMLIGQASSVIERADQSRALARMGAPRRFELKAIWLETFGPLIVAVLGCTLLGFAAASPMIQIQQKLGGDIPDNGVGIMTLIICSGLLVAALSVWACHPLHKMILERHIRRND
uniref:FtsX-like permease family protein n=1 Tax=Vaginimicrobium propionicum TaxID=1871034 RepID=UPI0009711E67|nr:FtsX-like permease family protein [Vaginimicrobium propionicum]